MKQEKNNTVNHELKPPVADHSKWKAVLGSSYGQHSKRMPCRFLVWRKSKKRNPPSKIRCDYWSWHGFNLGSYIKT